MNWYKIAQNQITARDIVDKWTQQGISLYITEKDNLIILESIIVPKEQRKMGIGSQIMQELIDYADQVGKRMEVSPGIKDFYLGTTSRNRLVNFYKRFDFVENKGRNKDFTTSKGMYRIPNELV